MTSMDNGDGQGRTADTATKYSAYSNPLFYSDAHARYLLSLGPRYVNVFPLLDFFKAGDRYVPGAAHVSRELADKHAIRPRYGRAAYRIVVKPKRVLA